MPSNKLIPDTGSALPSNLDNLAQTQPELASAFGIGSNTKQSFDPLPWDLRGLDTIESAFFRPYDIDPERWNKLYPYRLLVVDVTTNPAQVKSSSKLAGVPSQVETSVSGNGINYIVEQELLTGNWEVRLPITPQQLQIQDQYAINTSATMRGVIEEHNGVRFKQISMAGTTGIWPTKPTEGGSVTSKSSIETIFGGTIEAFQNTAENIRSVAKSFTGSHPNAPAAIAAPSSSELFSTGYYQALYLAQFLERYAEAKRRPENKNWRLVLDIPKQNQSFVVTPQTCVLKQSKEKPNHIFYNLTFKAWKRIDLAGTVGAADQNRLPTLETNDFQRLVNTIRDTRRALSSAVNLVKAVRSDFQRPFEILRQSSLAVKDAGGLVFSAAELPNQLISDFQSTIQESLLNLEQAFQRPNKRFRDTAGVGSFTPNAVSLKDNSPEQRAGDAVEAIKANRTQAEGLSGDQVSSGSLGQNAVDAAKVDPVREIFENPEANFELFDNIPLNNLDLTPQQEDAVTRSNELIETITIDTLRDFKSEMLSLVNDISNTYGTLDSTYAQIYGLQDPSSRAIELTIEENEVMLAIFNFIQVLDELTATKTYNDLSVQNPLEFVGGLAEETGLPFEDSPSKKPVPVPFGLSIEEIAARYLQDPDRWLEIATLNNLRSPYIDEDGYTLPLLSNGTGRQLTIEDDEDRLYIGQRVVLGSNTVPQFTAKIINVEEILGNQFLVSIDGDVDLSNLTTNDNAYLIGYLPGTVNSQNQIYIPTNEAANPDDRTFDIPNLIDPNNLARLSKIDWLLTDDGDVAINSVGEVRLAVGLTNLIQALKLKIQTKKGSLLRNLDYGLGLRHGVSVADIENGQLIQSLNKMLDGDSRFQGINRIQIVLNGATLRVNLSVNVASNGGVLPISFDVPAR